MLVLAWMFAIVGAIVAYIVSLAGAMRTVPRLYWREALVGVPLPIIAAALALWHLVRPAVPPATATERPWISASVALVLALLTLLLMAVSYFDQPSGRL